MAQRKKATARKRTTTKARSNAGGLQQVPLRSRKRPYMIVEARGSTGLGRNWQNVDDEWQAQLRGGRAIRQFREMRDNDAICGTV